MKIVYCLNDITCFGGIEIITMLKVGYLARIPGNRVFLAITEEMGEVPEQLSPLVSLIDLHVRYNDNKQAFPWNLVVLAYKRMQHKRRLSFYLKRIQPDIVVSTGNSEYAVLPGIKGNWKTVREFHLSKHYRLMDADSFSRRILARAAEFFDYHFIVKRYDQIVLLTQEDKDTYWRDDDHVRVIPNPTRFCPDKPSSLENKRIIAIGRLVYQKNFSSLLRCFAKICQLCPDWRLDIFGDGPERISLQAQIAELNIGNHVFLQGNTKHIQEELAASSMIVSTSRYEGFHLALLEAMSCGLPVVSYVCPCGPKDLVRHGIDGFLVAPGDEEDLTDKILQLVQDDALRKRMGKAALERSHAYSLPAIAPSWMALFNDLLQS